jgi:hypothetical protein
MKKLILILFILLVGCEKPELPNVIESHKDDIFSLTESSVTNGQSIHFKLQFEGEFFLTIIDKETNQVIGREKFYGKSGENIKKLYTNSIESKYLYLSLEDVTKKELKKTTIIIKN